MTIDKSKELLEDRSEGGIDRRSFLKGAAAGVAAAVGGKLTVMSDASAATPAEKPNGPARSLSETIISRPGSDFMVDVIKAIGLEYIAANPGSSFRSLQESIINYGGNKKPEFLTCLHEESSVAMAHGYAKAAGKPMGILAHGTVGLQHAAMGVYNAWCDRVPIIMFAGNGVNAATRRPGVEWYHSVQDPAAMLRDFLKWDDQPGSLQHFAESTVRAYKIATTSPMEPVLVIADMDLQEQPVEHKEALKIPKLTLAIPPQGDSAALREAAKMLVAAESPVILADRAARTQEGIKRMVQLAEALGAPVVDLGGRMNFPTMHALNLSNMKGPLIRNADVVLALEVAATWGQLNSVGAPYHDYRRLAKPDVKVISISLADTYMKSNYQDMQRFAPVDLSITGDAEATLPGLIEEIKKATSGGRKSAFNQRAETLRTQHDSMMQEARTAASYGWDVSPVTTARLAAEVWGVIKNEKWSLLVSDRVNWAKRLWPATEYHHLLGGSGGAGVGYNAPASVGAALANKAKGLISVTFQPDVDLLYAPGVLWTAAHHKIPLLFVMYNNRGYIQETMHLQRMAALHNRRSDQAGIGTLLDNPHVDFAKLAQALGVWSEGPVSDPAALAPALKRALGVVKGGAPALVDVICQAR